MAITERGKQIVTLKALRMFAAERATFIATNVMKLETRLDADILEVCVQPAMEELRISLGLIYRELNAAA